MRKVKQDSRNSVEAFSNRGLCVCSCGCNGCYCSPTPSHDTGIQNSSSNMRSDTNGVNASYA